MGKNWLIRTKSNHILGPVSKEKVLELYGNGSIKQDDEICTGNGYWFFIRETDLVDRYLKGDAIQAFNPMSEAKDVLTASATAAHDESAVERDDITLITSLDSQDRQTNPGMKTHAPALKIVAQEGDGIENYQKKKLKTDKQAKHSSTNKKQPQQNWFKYAGTFVFIVLFLIIYFRKAILKSFFSDIHMPQFSSLIISEAHGQDASSEKKKSS